MGIGIGLLLVGFVTYRNNWIHKKTQTQLYTAGAVFIVVGFVIGVV